MLRGPIFILGLHRSGTTLLYQMLAASGCFNIVTARHVICFDGIRNGFGGRGRLGDRLAERFAGLGLSNRGVDVVGLGPDTPEEYGFILDNLHAGMSITRRHFHVFRSVCEAIQRDCGCDRPLLLKNPWDFARGSLIRTLMPESRIIYIHRNPLHMLSSLYRVVVAATTRPDAYLSMLSDRYRALTECEFPWRVAQLLRVTQPRLLARALIRQTARFAAGYLQSVRSRLLGNRAEVQFESLCARPEDTIVAVLNGLGVEGRRVDYHAMIDTHNSCLAPEIARERDLVADRLSDYASAVGYDLAELGNESAGSPRPPREVDA